MTEPLGHDEGPFDWDKSEETEPGAAKPTRDLRRVAMVLGGALVILLGLVVVLLNVLSRTFGDMWDSVFTF